MDEPDEPESSLSDSFGATFDEPCVVRSAVVPLAGLDAPQAQAPAALPVPCAEPKAFAPKAKAVRGRPLGATAYEMARRRNLELPMPALAVPPLTVAEVAAQDGPEAARSHHARLAADKRWQRDRQQRADVAQATEPSIGADPVSEGQLSLVPYVEGAGAGPLAVGTVTNVAGQLNVFAVSGEKPKDASVEQYIVTHFCHSMSAIAAAEHQGKAARTMERRRRLLAFVLIVARRHFNNSFVSSFHEAVTTAFPGESKPLYFVTKYKYDGMSAAVSLEELSKKRVDAVNK